MEGGKGVEREEGGMGTGWDEMLGLLNVAIL